MRYKMVRKLPFHSWAFYVVIHAVIATALFLLVYYYFTKPMPWDAAKLGWIFLDSYVTGIVAMLAARSISRYWKLGYDLKTVLAGVLVSAIYALIVFFGGISAFVDAADWWQAFLILLMVKITITWGAQLYAMKATNKLARGITG